MFILVWCSALFQIVCILSVLNQKVFTVIKHIYIIKRNSYIFSVNNFFLLFDVRYHISLKSRCYHFDVKASLIEFELKTLIED